MTLDLGVTALICTQVSLHFHMSGVTLGRLALPGDVWRYPGTFGVTRGRLALPGDVWRYLGTFGVTRRRLALRGDVWRYGVGLISPLITNLVISERTYKSTRTS